ncbi:glycosyltransferase family 39 protein [Kitasatospora sp. NPDC057015]|uniref:glycosyltransferase family 39 protein n=1 Tax=Kitasatospora sp. NPDC057015 TaxID=3346001 RepID=UPI00363F7981
MARTAPTPSPAPSTDPDPPLRAGRRARHGLRAVRPRGVRALLHRVWVLPVLATLAAGLFKISTPVMWHDELATLTVVRRPTVAILAMLQNVDAVHGTYYLLLHYWILAFGESPAMLRMPTVLAMTAAAGCVALTGRRLFGSRAGLVGGLVFAMIPSVTRYGQEVRSYAFVVLAAAAALLLLLRALERPTLLRWFCYSLAVAAAAYLHLVSLTFLGAHALGVAMCWWRDRRNWRLPVGFTLSAGLGAACAYPLVKLGEVQVTRQLGWIAVPKAGDLLAIWGGVFCGTLMAGGVLLAGALAWGTDRRFGAALCSTAAVLPVVVIWAVSRYGETSYFIPKYMFFVLPACAVLAGAGITAVRPRGVVAALIALGLLASQDQIVVRQPLSHAHYLYPEPLTMFVPLDYRAAATIIDEEYRPGDGAAYGQQRMAVWWGVDIGVAYYLDYLPHHVKVRDVFAGTSGKDRQDLWPTVCATPATCLHDEPRIWLVSKDDGDADVLNTVYDSGRAVLQQHYTVTRVDRVSGLTVALLVRK